MQSVDASVVSQDLFTAQADIPSNNPLPAAPPIDEECESMDSTNSNDGETAPSKPESAQASYPVMYSAYVTPYPPFSLSFWPGYNPEQTKKEETHEVFKPTAVHSKTPINVDELVGMSKLSLGESIGENNPSSLSLKLVEGSTTRQSAFHANPASSSSRMNSSNSPIHAL